ncbi:PREDICTED: uncharacterized protein LOC105592450 [Cercocebus atys]|uniref:uncharacterized protein LOC105592450 n=1 Tax=Cercocebus atys TaxID=9531 RepID=UPI0005F3EBE5|nr:PREDICTED: uncharacterized protein LOC105592450 [Cercocebus atys]
MKPWLPLTEKQAESCTRVPDWGGEWPKSICSLFAGPMGPGGWICSEFSCAPFHLTPQPMAQGSQLLQPSTKKLEGVGCTGSLKMLSEVPGHPQEQPPQPRDTESLPGQAAGADSHAVRFEELFSPGTCSSSWPGTRPQAKSAPEPVTPGRGPPSPWRPGAQRSLGAPSGGKSPEHSQAAKAGECYSGHPSTESLGRAARRMCSFCESKKTVLTAGGERAYISYRQLLLRELAAVVRVCVHTPLVAESFPPNPAEDLNRSEPPGLTSRVKSKQVLLGLLILKEEDPVHPENPLKDVGCIITHSGRKLTKAVPALAQLPTCCFGDEE